MSPKARPRRSSQPVKGGLRGFAEARKSNIGLLNDIRTHVVAEANKNAGVGREAHKIHVSELIKSDACPRRMYYKVAGVPATDAARGAYHRLEIIWAAGHQEHAKWQRWIREMGVLFGTWKCMVCEASFEATSPSECENCGAGNGFLEYAEVNLTSTLYPLVGHADGAVSDRECFVEVKSFSIGTVRIEKPDLVKEHTHKVDGKTIVDDDAVWQDIKRPLPSHLKQGVMYLWMAEQMGLPYKSIVYIYENKKSQDTKAFEVTLSKRLIQEYLDVLDGVMAAVEEGVAPPRPKLFTRDSKPCNECQFRTTCYGDSDSVDSGRDDDEDPETTRVPARRSRQRGRTEGREAAVRSAGEAQGEDAPGPRRRDRDGRPRVHGPDDPDPAVGGALRRPARDGGGGREVGRVSEGQGTRSRFSRKREGRDRA